MSKTKQNISDDTKAKLSRAMKGKKHSDQTKKKMSDAKKKMSADTKKKISESQKGKKHSDQTKKKISDTKKGKTYSDDTKRKMSDAKKGIPQKTGQCPRCLKLCSLSNLARWHLDNCKLNPNKPD